MNTLIKLSIFLVVGMNAIGPDGKPVWNLYGDECKILDDFVSEKSKSYFFLDCRSMTVFFRNDTAERAVNLMQDFKGLTTVEEKDKQLVLRFEQEHKNLYPDCEKLQ